ncbi:MAG: hypothetical protein E7264_07605 [Lachnospiraceae bacterium]|nr:hypothetical protein [Lachnospiraceae bacterium]
MEDRKCDWINCKNNQMNGKQKLYMYLCICFFAVILTGCNTKGVVNSDAPQVTIAEYQKDIYQTTIVQCKTIEPKLVLTLTPDEYEVNSYSIQQDLLKVAECYVEEGERVEAGEVMVTFENDGLEKAIEQYEQRKTEDQLLIDHYTKLQKIDRSQNYKKDIKKLKADISVVQAYINEKKAMLSDYQLVASKAGVVTDVSEQLHQGYARKASTLIKVASGSSNYITATSDDYAFQVGDTYDATCNMASYEMKVINVVNEDEKHQIVFEPVSDMTGITETDELILEIAKTPISNAICVEEEAIVTVRDNKYVFLLDEQGYRHAVPVTVREVIDGYAILSNGIEQGEQVTLN